MSLSERKFQRVQEDFVCAKCGVRVEGTGYTNHCPKCLWSKHVDNNPGDRAATCNGDMEPIGIEIEDGVYKLTHKCVKCGKIIRNSSAEDDNMEELIKLSNRKNV